MTAGERRQEVEIVMLMLMLMLPLLQESSKILSSDSREQATVRQQRL